METVKRKSRILTFLVTTATTSHGDLVVAIVERLREDLRHSFLKKGLFSSEGRSQSEERGCKEEGERRREETKKGQVEGSFAIIR